ncbi:MAG: hypothetical protein K2M46_07665 [Lachnospiraceae bacterium]|nr:hypothetical protein [Lachnospiraceae bacterium]
MRKIAKILLCMLAVLALYAIGGQTVKAASYEEITVDYVTNYSAMENAEHMIRSNFQIESSDNNKKSQYAQFTLKSDSYVKVMSTYEYTKGSTYVTKEVKVFSNVGMSAKKMEIVWNWWDDKDSYAYATAFLPAGTYYMEISVRDASTSGVGLTANIRTSVAAIPCSQLLKLSSTANKNRTNATVKVAQTLGSNKLDMQYCAGSIGMENVNNGVYWKVLRDDFQGRVGNNRYEENTLQSSSKLLADTATSFSVKQNGIYTIRITDHQGNAYLKTISVQGVDTKAPTVTGVKNNRTYKKTVTIKFKDEKGGSGIRKATLNNKRIKSSKKVSKNGFYTLKVTDKAGNTRTIKFKIKK